VTDDSRTPEPPTTRVNLAVLPPADVVNAVVEYAHSLISEEDSLFVIDGIQRRAHLTLYMAEFPQAQSTSVEILARVTAALEGHRPVQCSTASVSVVDGGFVELGYEKTADLLELQSKIVSAAESLAQEATLPSHTRITPARAASLKLHKYEYTGDSFRPHITLGRVLRTVTLSVDLITQLPNFSFSGSALVIGPADDQGSIRRLLHSINL
jgi:2'-5' RNA ligase superfamily